jgi:hypothetical protein
MWNLKGKCRDNEQTVSEDAQEFEAGTLLNQKKPLQYYKNGLLLQLGETDTYLNQYEHGDKCDDGQFYFAN